MWFKSILGRELQEGKQGLAFLAKNIFAHKPRYSQEPERIILGEYPEWKGTGPQRRCTIKKDELMYIPLLRTIECFLQSDTIRSEV